FPESVFFWRTEYEGKPVNWSVIEVGIASHRDRPAGAGLREGAGCGTRDPERVPCPQVGFGGNVRLSENPHPGRLPRKELRRASGGLLPRQRQTRAVRHPGELAGRRLGRSPL